MGRQALKVDIYEDSGSLNILCRNKEHSLGTYFSKNENGNWNHLKLSNNYGSFLFPNLPPNVTLVVVYVPR
jgi:hypothetical protein